MEKMSTNFKDFISGYSIEVVPNSAAKIESFKEILPIKTRVYIAHLETETWPWSSQKNMRPGP